MNERFVLTNHNREVSVLDTGHDLVEEEGNALLFGLNFVTESGAECMVQELEPLVRILNEQDKELKEMKRGFKND